jgi:hypothetical protein
MNRNRTPRARFDVRRHRAVLAVSLAALILIALPASASAVSFSGTGSKKLGPVHLAGGQMVVTWEWLPQKNGAYGNFTVDLYDADGQLAGQLLNELGFGSSGTAPARIAAESFPEGEYTIDVYENSSGSWKLRIDPAGPPVSTLSFTGKGNTAVGPFRLPGGATKFQWTETCAIQESFIVNLIDHHGRLVALLASNLGKSSGGTVDVAWGNGDPLDPGLYMLDVRGGAMDAGYTNSGGTARNLVVNQWSMSLTPVGPPPAVEEQPPAEETIDPEVGDQPQGETGTDGSSTTTAAGATGTTPGASGLGVVLQIVVFGLVGLAALVLFGAIGYIAFLPRKRPGGAPAIAGTTAATAAATVPVFDPAACTQCGAALIAGVAVCPACGLERSGTVAPQAQAAAASTCPQCGGSIAAGVPACPACELATSAGSVPQGASATVGAVDPADARANRAGQIAFAALSVILILLIGLATAMNALGLVPRGSGGSTATPETVPLPKEAPAAAPITTPQAGSTERTELVDAARAGLGTSTRFVVECLYVQGDDAVGVIGPEGSHERLLVVWARLTGVWAMTWKGTPDAAGRAAMEKAGLGLSSPLVAKLSF